MDGLEEVVVPVRNDSEIVIGLAAFVLDDISRSEISNLRKLSSNLLDNQFFPKYFFKIDNFPLSVSKKTDRKKLEQTAKDLLNK